MESQTKSGRKVDPDIEDGRKESESEGPNKFGRRGGRDESEGVKEDEKK